MEKNIITINENSLAFEPGETILSIAQRNKIDIPRAAHPFAENLTRLVC